MEVSAGIETSKEGEELFKEDRRYTDATPPRAHLPQRFHYQSARDTDSVRCVSVKFGDNKRNFVAIALARTHPDLTCTIHYLHCKTKTCTVLVC